MFKPIAYPAANMKHRWDWSEKADPTVDFYDALLIVDKGRVFVVTIRGEDIEVFGEIFHLAEHTAFLMPCAASIPQCYLCSIAGKRGVHKSPTRLSRIV